MHPKLKLFAKWVAPTSDSVTGVEAIVCFLRVLFTCFLHVVSMKDSSQLLQALHTSLPSSCKVRSTKEYRGNAASRGLLDVKDEIIAKLLSTRECIWECMTAAGKSKYWPGIACSAVRGCILFVSPISVDIPDIAWEANTASYWQRGGGDFGGSSTKTGAKLHVISLGLFLKWFAQDPELLGNYSLIAFDEFDEAKYGNASFSTVLVQVRQRAADLGIKLALLSATVPLGLENMPRFEYHERRYPLTVLEVEIENGADSFQVVTNIGANLLKLGHTSILFFPGEAEINTACENGGKDFIPFHAKLSEEQIETTRQPASSARCLCSSTLGEKGTTIPDIDFALCAGVARTQRDTNGVSEYMDNEVDEARAFQRMSRAGRTKAGVGLRIVRSDLPKVLRASYMGLFFFNK